MHIYCMYIFIYIYTCVTGTLYIYAPYYIDSQFPEILLNLTVLPIREIGFHCPKRSGWKYQERVLPQVLQSTLSVGLGFALGLSSSFASSIVGVSSTTSLVGSISSIASSIIRGASTTGVSFCLSASFTSAASAPWHPPFPAASIGSWRQKLLATFDHVFLRTGWTWEWWRWWWWWWWNPPKVLARHLE